MPSDHVIANLAAFHDAVIRGLPAAAQGGIVTFGVVPERPETGYGYINAGSADERGALPIIRFVEKPDSVTAQQYVACSGYFWNSGIFLVRADTWLTVLAAFAPDMVDACRHAHENGVRDIDFFRVKSDAFISCPADSIDYAVMEKLPSRPDLGIGGFVIPLDAGWSDLGSWDSVWTAAEKDASGNAVSGDVLLQDTRNSLVHAGGRLVACVGLDDIVVVETADAVLVARKDRVQNVKHIVVELRRTERVEAALHRKVARPWGTYDCVDAGERFQVKRIIVKPGAVLSLQMHHHRAEHWIVVRGTARISRGDESILLSENQSTYIPLGVRHRLENPGKVPLELIEVQSGSYLGEDDIVRFEDLYGRRKDSST
ncbi:MAG: algA [Nitrospirae bacterium]|nr:MAG: algA [Nitrospirota bacterium]